MSIFFTKENQTLYPATWEYNALLIIDELATIIENNGGRVKPGYRAGYIQNRSIDNAIIEYQTRAERIAAAIDEYPDSGKNGPRRAARQLAIDYQYLTDCGGLSYMELSRINNYFETIGARYGLITEYRENAII